MEIDLINGPTSIMHLPDDCLYFIFQRLDCGSDRESFGLICHRWLHIQNSSRQSLQFECSFSVLNASSLSRNSTTISPFRLYRLLNRFRQLQSLSLSGCMDLPDSSLTQLQYYGSTLEALYLDCCFGITDNGLSYVAAGCTSLTFISLYRCNVTDVGLQILAKSCLALKDVNLSYCLLITDHGIKALSQNCRQLRGVVISYCKSVNGVGFKGCSQSLTNLEAESCKLEPEGVLGIVSGGGLEYLSVSCLSWCVHGDGLAAIGSGFATRLRVLNFRLCRTINDESIVAIAKGCPLLEDWNLALCHEVKLPGWEAIGANCCNLKRLHVNRCHNLCNLGLQALRDGCRRLLILHINRCRRISSEAMELFKLRRTDVEIKQEEVLCMTPNPALWLRQVQR
ncbi:F-box/LRR-repeat protein [Actinidia chinensis var. chinensis]|uniref:F-box/LRR-repeat protein n=1 Tax=Actinidia chinensis var. chinensis TaxID=1590841 RepID=A0A2R6QJN0_ACTCC|nr:F-box/LRR-repeat protein [Actinidia chinensis var. chinensis]